MRKFHRPDEKREGVSDVLGSILLVANSVMLFTVILWQVMTYQPALPGKKVDFDYEYEDGTLNITMTSGPALSPWEIQIYIVKDMVKMENYSAVYGLNDDNGNSLWDAGETWSHSLTTSVSGDTEVEIYDTYDNKLLDFYPLSEAMEANLVDLKISSEDIYVADDNVNERDSNIPIQAWIFNIGTGTATSEITVSFIDEYNGVKRVIDIVSVNLGSGLESGGAVQASTSWTPSEVFGGNIVGVHTIWVEVSPYRGENTISNNQASVVVYVRQYSPPQYAPDEPDLSISPVDISHTPSYPQRGDTVVLTGIVVNQGQTYATCDIVIYDGEATDADEDGVPDTPAPPVLATEKGVYVRDVKDFRIYISGITGGLHELTVFVENITSEDPSLPEQNFVNNYALYDLYVRPKVLLVDDDNSSASANYTNEASYIMNTLSAVGYSYDYYYVSSSGYGPAYDFGATPMKNYDVIIWDCGMATTGTLRKYDIQNLTVYLDEGGNVLLMGSGILNDFISHGNTDGLNFLEKYFGVDSAATLDFELQAINGTNSTLTDLDNVSYSVESVSSYFDRSDSFNLVSSTSGLYVESVLYDALAGEQYIMGAAVNNSTSAKTMFASFLFPLTSTPAYRAQLAFQIFRFFGIELVGDVHDLALVDLEISPSNPGYMDTITIQAIVQNNGNNRETNIKVAFYANDELIPEYPYGDSNIQTIDSLDGNGTLSDPLTMRMLVTEVGEMTISVVVDPFDAIREVSEVNNDQSYSSEFPSAIEVRNSILVVDDDNTTSGTEDTAANITRALNFLGYPYDIYRTVPGGDGPDLSTIKTYNIVIWDCGNETTDTLTDTDISTIGDYLSGNYPEADYFSLEANMFLMGQGILDDLHARGEDLFIQQYLHIVPASISYGDGAGSTARTATPYSVEMAVNSPFQDLSDSFIPRPEANTFITSNGVKALSYDYTDDSSPSARYRMVFSSLELSAITSGTEGSYQWAHQILTVYLVMELLDYGDQRLDYHIEDAHISVSNVHPVLGDAYTVTAKIYNHGETSESVIVRLMDGETLVKSKSIAVPASSYSEVEFIWTPLYAGPREISIQVDPDNDKEEVFEEVDNYAYYDTLVYFFYDDMENGTGNWDHDATLLKITGKDYSGVSTRPADVLLAIVIDSSTSMEDRTNGMGETWLEVAKESARILLDSLTDNSMVSVWSFGGTNPVQQTTDVTLLDETGRPAVEAAIDGITVVGGMTPIWDTIGDAYMQIKTKESSYPQLTPALVVLSDGADYASNDASTFQSQKLEAASDEWCPWGDMQPDAGYPTQNYPGHRGKYVVPYNDPLPGKWQTAGSGSYNPNRKGLLYSDIPIFTIGLGLEHYEPPNQPVMNTWPGNGVQTNDAVYENAADSLAVESGTTEYNLWRISSTSGAKYYYSPSSDELQSIFQQVAQDIGQLVTRGVEMPRSGDTRDGSVLEYMNAPVFSRVLNEWEEINNFTVNTMTNNTNLTKVFHSINSSYMMYEPSSTNATLSANDPWHLNNTTAGDKSLVTPPVDLRYAESAILSFYHLFYLKQGSNGGVVLVGTPTDPSNPMGTYRWRYVTPKEPYNGNIPPSEWSNRTDDYGTQMAWCWNGRSDHGRFDWQRDEVDLTRFVGNWIKIKFLYMYHSGGTGLGWAIDDVEIKATRGEEQRVTEDTKDQWHVTATDSVSGNHSWWCGIPDTQELGNGIDNSLYTRPIDLTSAVNATFEASFKFNIRTDAGRPPDGFRVEVTTDNGDNWLPLTYGVRSAWGVSGTAGDASDGIPGDGKSYTGIDSGDNWVYASSLTRVNVNLNGLVGNVIMLRFRVVTAANDVAPALNPYYGLDHIEDPSAGFGGIYIDDVMVYGWSQQAAAELSRSSHSSEVEEVAYSGSQRATPVAEPRLGDEVLNPSEKHSATDDIMGPMPQANETNGGDSCAASGEGGQSTPGEGHEENLIISNMILTDSIKKEYVTKVVDC